MRLWFTLNWVAFPCKIIWKEVLTSKHHHAHDCELEHSLPEDVLRHFLLRINGGSRYKSLTLVIRGTLVS